MYVAKAKLKSLSPYSQSAHHEEPKKDKETHSDYEERTWRHKCHADEKGNIYIPPMAFKNCISEAAKYLSIQIPGKGKSTYTKHFEAGAMVRERVFVGATVEEVQGEKLFVPSDGKRGGGRRVFKYFPVIPEWAAEVDFYILDETITEAVFKLHLEEAGKFIGVGRFRPRNNGYYGRFQVAEVTWTKWNG